MPGLWAPSNRVESSHTDCRESGSQLVPIEARKEQPDRRAGGWELGTEAGKGAAELGYITVQ